MLHRTEGIVVRTREYGEADLIVTFLTRDFGIIHTFAKSPRKTKSRFGSSLEPLSYVRMSFWGKENASLPRLTQSDIIKTFQPIRESYDSFLKISELLELLIRCCPERDVSVPMFHFLLNGLKSVESFGPYPILLISLKIKLLKRAGFAPKLSGCAKCGSAGLVFYFQEGAVVCGRCSTRSRLSHRLSPGAVRLYECLSMWEMEKINRIRSNDLLINELTSIIDSHVKYHIPNEIRAGRTTCSA